MRDHPRGVESDLPGEPDEPVQVGEDRERVAPEVGERFEERAAQARAGVSVGPGEAIEEELLPGGEPEVHGPAARPRPPEEQGADVVESLDAGKIPRVARGEPREVARQRLRLRFERPDVPRAGERDGACAVGCDRGGDRGRAYPRCRGV